MTARKQPKGGARERPSSNREPFTHLYAGYAEWVSARATAAHFDAHPTKEIKPEAAASAAYDAVTTAEWRLIETPSSGLIDIKLRARIVQTMFLDVAAMGEPSDNRHLTALAVLVNEVMDLHQ